MFFGSSAENREGFTFLELLIAVTIFSVIATAVYSSFNIGIRAWRKAEDSYKVRQEARHTLENIGRDLRCAVNFTRNDPGGSPVDSFEGSSGRISFWRTLKEGIFKVTYTFDKETGSVYYVLQTYKESTGDEEGSRSLLASAVSGLKLKYAYKDGDEIVWQDEWSSEKPDIPMGVKVILSYGADNEAMTAEFSDTVLIPTGIVKDLSEEP